MSKLFSYLKKSIIPIVFILVFLLIQAQCDLALPSYTSDIINVGIQQGGIESAVPEVIRESSMNEILIFTQEDEDILSQYTLISAGDSEYSDEYDVINNENAYILNDISDEAKSELENRLLKPMMMVTFLSAESQMSAQIKDSIVSSFPEGTISDDMSIIQILSMLPDEQLQPLLESFDEQLEAIDDSILSQMGIQYVKTEYSASGVDVDSKQTEYIISAGIKMLGIALAAMVVAILISFLASRVAASFARDIRTNTFKKVMSFSNEEFDKFSTASLITRCTNDVQQVQQITVMLLRMLLYAPILGVGAVIKVVRQGSSMSWVIGVAVGVILVVVLILFSFVMPKFKLVQKYVDRLNLIAREILTGLPVIRAFSTEKHEEKRFDNANGDLTKLNLFVNRVMTIMMPTMMFIMNGVTVLILWVGADKVDAGAMQVGDITAFITYTMQIIMSFLMLSMMSIMLPRAMVSAKRIGEILNTEVAIVEPENTKYFSGEKGHVEFRNVSFRYPHAESDVLSDISFEAKRGETVAIIGSTGSGKSTLVNLVPRFYDVTEGSILIDGTDIREVSLHELRDKIGYVPQKGVLFSGDIKSNILYGNENGTQEQMLLAARVAQATEFIETKPEKYDSYIAQGGNNVSGGQKQRLSIARAIATDPEVYIFDDSFSALDYKTDVVLRNALREVTANSTIIIVAQRISTVINADQIIVLDDGKIVGKGTHTELLNNCDEYRQIALSQLSEDEVKKSMGGVN